MYLKVCISLVGLLTVADGFFLPVFVRKQHPLSNPAVGFSPQSSWSPASGSPYHSPASSIPSSSLASVSNPNPQVSATVGTNAYKDYNPYSQVQQVQAATQYGYETPYQIGSYPQYHSGFQSVQLVPCLCPLSKDIIEQQSHQYQVSLGPGSSSPTSSASSSLSPVVESSNANDVLVKGGQKVGS